MINCPKCSHEKTFTRNLRDHPDGLVRYRQCDKCGYTFSTMEQYANAPRAYLKAGRRVVPRDGIHPAILHISDYVNGTDLSTKRVSRKAGLHPYTLTRWLKGKHAASIYDVEAVLNVMGFTLRVVGEDDD